MLCAPAVRSIPAGAHRPSGRVGRHVVVTEPAKSVVDHGEDELKRASGVVLPALNGAPASGFEFISELDLKGMRDIVGHACIYPVHRREAVGGMVSKPWPRVAGGDTRLDNTADRVLNNIEGIPGVASAVPADPDALLHGGWHGRGLVAAGAPDAVTYLASEPEWFEDLATELDNPDAEVRFGNLRVEPNAGPADADAALHVFG